MNPRIILLTQYFLPEMGAPQNRLFDLASGLKRLGWEVTVVTALPNYPTGAIFSAYKNKFSCLEQVGGIETKRYWLYPSNATRAIPRILSMISFSVTSLFSLFFVRSKQPAFILVESPPLTLAFSGWILSRLSGAKMIMNVSDLWPLTAKELGVIKPGWIYNRLVSLEHFLYRRADLCVGQSQEIVDHIEKITPGKVYLFRNGFDASRIAPSGYNPAMRNCLVYAGLLGVAQGILALCKSVDFRQLGVELHIYGTGAEKDEIERYCNTHLEKGIRYRGVLQRDEMPSVLSAYGGALIVLVRNIYGAVPSKIYEAMACGLPIIFSGEGEGAAIIEKYKAGWTNLPEDLSGLKNNIGNFRNLPEAEFRQRRLYNLEVLKMNFDRNRLVESFNDFLRKGPSDIKPLS